MPRVPSGCLLFLAAALPWAAPAQVYSPRVLLKGQPDSTDLQRFARDIYAQAGAKTPREKAEAIWRFFLTDGRFVKPGFWYHIAGWAYEEPGGELLDPMKLLNSYGFGLCYQIAPVLEAVWEAGGFEDARVWFLTGHTVTEVLYAGGYHHYDSDMLGYSTIGEGPPRLLPVASVHDLERDGKIILSKMTGPRQADRSAVDDPWYPADVRAGEMKGLAGLFTSTQDNRLFPFTRFPQGHRMDFVLRPGERLVRYFHPEEEGLYYLPYRFNGREWTEFPREIAEYQIRTADGPHSQKDARRWGTGRLEYHPPLGDRNAYYPRFAAGFNEGFTVPGGARPVLAPAAGRAASAVFEVRSPYVIIDASFDVDASLGSPGGSLKVETSTDAGRHWLAGATLQGPHSGRWKAESGVLTRSAHGRRTAVSGVYQYLVRFTLEGAVVRDVLLSTRIQVNPRTLPALAAGRNELVYAAGPQVVRRALAAGNAGAAETFERVSNARFVAQNGQGYWVPQREGPAEFTFRVGNPDGEPITGFDAGARFLDLGAGLAPDKFTAEVRKITPADVPAAPPAASIAWGTSPDGPFQTLWEYDPKLTWKDGQAIDRTLCWPEVDRHVATLPPGTRNVYVRYRMQGMAMDQPRLAVESAGGRAGGGLEVTHVWRENGAEKTRTERIAAGAAEYRYAIQTAPGAAIANESVALECPWPARAGGR